MILTAPSVLSTLLTRPEKLSGGLKPKRDAPVPIRVAQCVELIQQLGRETVDQDHVGGAAIALAQINGKLTAESAVASLEGPRAYGG